MKKSDFIVILCVLVVLVPFFVPATGFYDWFSTTSKSYPIAFVLAFFKFAILATFGEMLALRIRKGHYYEKGFGVLPRMMVWGFLGICITLAMIVFKSGTPVFLSKLGIADINTITETFAPGSSLTWGKLGIAFAVSVLMNTIFAPVMMTFHKCTDIHILKNGGTVRGLLRPMKMTECLKAINWDAQWGLVIKKTIPLFWYPAHTITFILPEEFQVLFAALLGVALGLILALAGNKK